MAMSRITAKMKHCKPQQRPLSQATFSGMSPLITFTATRHDSKSFDQQHKLHSASLASDSSSVDRAAKSLPTTSRLDEVGDSPRLSQQHALICLWSCNHLFTQRAPQWYS
mmetsp:Transcript_57705/g.159733  ORF Transcript_57705/g.159733 Transcript_57705/m.159733 type:complete len:110 (-) Transcript_57705:4-333(-)